MLDIGWQELLVIGALALIVVGPKDLPTMLRRLGQYVGKIRGLARDFQRTMDQAARDADLAELKELRELKRDMQKSVSMDYKDQAKKAADSLANPPKKADPQKADPLAEFDKVKETPDPVASDTAGAPENSIGGDITEPVAAETAAPGNSTPDEQVPDKAVSNGAVSGKA